MIQRTLRSLAALLVPVALVAPFVVVGARYLGAARTPAHTRGGAAAAGHSQSGEGGGGGEGNSGGSSRTDTPTDTPTDTHSNGSSPVAAESATEATDQTWRTLKTFALLSVRQRTGSMHRLMQLTLRDSQVILKLKLN